MDDPYKDVSKLDPGTRISNTLTVLQPGEHVICTIKRHPIGILGVYGLCGLVAIVTAVLSFGLAPSIFSDSSSRQIFLTGSLISLIVGATCAAFALIATKVYWGNAWTLTTDSLTQVDQLSLFKRHSSQLSLESLEDVTAEQNGILTRLFNYGLLKVETAGERSKFVFPFCPNPNYYAAQILSAREKFDQHSDTEENIYRQPVPSVQPPMPPESAAAMPQQQPLPPASPSAAPSPEIDSYEVPGGPPDSV